MTDAEWHLLEPLVTGPVVAGPVVPLRGHPPADPRRTWDATVWIACSTGPWRALPSGLGRADTAHRTLCRGARSGVLNILTALSDHPKVRRPLNPFGCRVARIWRRATRPPTLRQFLLDKVLGPLDALPCHPDRLPRPFLSETLAAHAKLLFALPWKRAWHRYLLHLHRPVADDRRCWRLTE